MARSIDSLINEADELIFKRTKTAAPIVNSVDGDHEAVKLANLLLSEDEDLRDALNVKTAAPVAEDTILEKVASALVINEMLLGLEKFEKIEQFEKKAAAEGYTQEQINEFVVENLL